MKVINFGSMNVDYVYSVDRFLLPGETRPCRERNVYAGGKGLNQSIALAKAGAEVYHAGAVGTDGGLLLDALRDAGVKTDYLQRMDIAGGHTVIQVDDNGQNCILLYGGTNRCLTMEYVDSVLAQFSPGDIVLLQNETNLVGEIINRAGELGLKTALNAAPMDAAAKKYPLEKLDMLLINELEGAELAGSVEEETIIERLSKRYKKTCIVLTLGSDGVHLRSPNDDVRMGAFTISDVVDTTAAGDTFTGYFLKAVIDGLSSDEALLRASAASAIAIQKQGAAASIPTYDAVDKWLENIR